MTKPPAIAVHPPSKAWHCHSVEEALALLGSSSALGSTTVICTDKTGTLTVGEMTVRAKIEAFDF